MTFELPCFGIVVHTDGGSGTIQSDLHEDDWDFDDAKYDNIRYYNAAMDGIESMILAHACAGVDIASPAYIEGIETAVEACGNNF